MLWSHIDLSAATIFWPADTDKKRYEQVMPHGAPPEGGTVRGAEEIAIHRNGMGVSSAEGSKACDTHLLDRWLHRMYKLAGVEPRSGGLWNPFRRKWATERKQYSVVDVAAAGGWRDVSTVQGVYQQTDSKTIRRVVLEPSHRLRSDVVPPQVAT